VSTRRTTRLLAALAGGAVVLSSLTGCTAAESILWDIVDELEATAPEAAPDAESDANAGFAESDEPLLEQLATVDVKGRAPKTGYERDEFGSGWKDPDRNGCDARNDMLRRDLRDVELKEGTNGCVVLAGTLDDAFTATEIDFVRGPNSGDVQIDHLVALSDAWQKGAQRLDEEERVLFANDPLNLLAVDGPSNSSKGDADAATWLPPNRGFWCDYVARQTAVKAKYELWMTAAERDAVEGVVTERCPDARALAID